MDNHASMRRLYSIFLIAEAPKSEWVAVPLVGWSLSRVRGELAYAHLRTHSRNRDAMQRPGLVEGRESMVIDNEHVAAPRGANVSPISRLDYSRIARRPADVRCVF